MQFLRLKNWHDLLHYIEIPDVQKSCLYMWFGVYCTAQMGEVFLDMQHSTQKPSHREETFFYVSFKVTLGKSEEARSNFPKYWELYKSLGTFGKISRMQEEFWSIGKKKKKVSLLICEISPIK